VLAEILAAKRDEVTLLHQPQTRDALRRVALEAPPTRPFVSALRRPDSSLAVIGELKRRSPSKGALALDLDPVDVAKRYTAGGVAALSVLTDSLFFGGSVADLADARAACDVPVLRKDFTIDEVQLYEARAIGADAVLLIVAALTDDALLRDLHDHAVALGLGVVVEAHDEAELDRALGIEPSVVGVNSRDLATFREDLGVAATLASRVPSEVVAVAESAVRSEGDAGRMAAAGYDAVLVGEALVRSDDPESLARAMCSCRVVPRSR